MKKKIDANPEQRTHMITVRMNEQEWQMFQEQLKKFEMQQSDFIRQAITTAQVKVTVRSVYDGDVLEKLSAELGKIGSNINQIARYLNQGNPMTVRLAKELNHCFADVVLLKKKIEELAGEL